MRRYIIKTSVISLSIIVSSCAMNEMMERSPQEVWDQGNPKMYTSTLTPKDLADCIYNNSNDSWGGTQQAGVVQLDSGDYQVIRGSEKQRVVTAVVRISAENSGSRADFRFNGYDVGLASHVSDMTEGCK